MEHFWVYGHNFISICAYWAYADGIELFTCCWIVYLLTFQRPEWQQLQNLAITIELMRIKNHDIFELSMAILTIWKKVNLPFLTRWQKRWERKVKNFFQFAILPFLPQYLEWGIWPIHQHTKCIQFRAKRLNNKKLSRSGHFELWWNYC